MKRFNPEKELSKIRNGNKNKILYSIIALLVIIGIGSTYALYQVRNSKKIVYTTVKDFSRDIKLAVFVDGKKQDDFPKKEDGVAYSGIKCNNDNVTANWNNDSWTLNLDAKGPDKCNVLFKTSQSFKEIMIPNSIDILQDETPDSNIRYVGQNPNNYIWFNCIDYNNLTQETAQKKCEKWRIIGLMNNISTINSEKESLVKIVRNEDIGSYSFDNRDNAHGGITEYGLSDYATSTLMKLLNPGYEGYYTPTGTFANNSLYWNSTSGLCLNGQNYATEPCDFNNKGLRDATKNKIEKVIWNLGTINTTISEETKYMPNNTPLEFYQAEHSKNSFYSPTWVGYVGLLYVSDYGFATFNDYNNLSKREACLLSIFSAWTPDNCGLHWLSGSTWLMNSRSVTAGTVDPMLINTVGIFTWGAAWTFYVKPVLYLKNNVMVIDGKGTEQEPYILS